ncbi:hypothetical protein RUM44_009676 [Polyplax serrata]|uniref:G-protein coupled receptors family 2 profile 1 domain-containing protein n=1 Tax=Polyplax serrata TaxID=468196 RepID=A0ABR1ATD4_POLSC
MMDTKNESVGKVIRHLYRKIQAENEKSFTRRQFDYGKEESQTPEDLSDVASEKLMQTFTDEVDPTGSECERPDYVTGNEDEHEVHCDWHNDTVLCWPRTLRGTTAYLPCFDEYNGIKYDSSVNELYDYFARVEVRVGGTKVAVNLRKKFITR